MALDIPIEIDTVESTATAIPTRTPRIDFEAGRIYGYIDGLDAMEQYVIKTLRTPRYECLAYDSQYGSEINTLVGEGDEDLFQSEAKRMVKDALMADERVTNVYDFVFERNGDSRTVRFSVETIFGTLQNQEVTVSV